MKKILSIDGGGIRGILSAILLSEIEERIGKPSHQIFDLIVGTSTGGILGAALSIGIPAKDIVEMYKKESKTIFPTSFWRRINNYFLNEKYPATGIEFVLAKYFDGLSLKDTKCLLAIPAYDIERMDTYFFKTDGKEDWLLRDVCRATSAAPTYFEPAIIAPKCGKETHAFIDGGVVFNNPAMCAYAEAKSTWPNEELCLVSLGTGECVRSVWRESVAKGSLLNWAKKLMPIMFDGDVRGIHHQVRKILGDRYFRFQPKLTEDLSNMDVWSGKNIPALEIVGEDYIDNQLGILTDVVDMLK